jgi:acyl-CoA synthetase (NDP forming)
LTARPLLGSALAQALLRPRSVALVGASDDPGKTTGRPLRFLRQAGFAGAVYPVNPHRAQVQGERAWPDLRSLPEVPDHVFILSGTDTVADVVAQCGALGIPVATVLASGFGESGAEGQAREAQLLELARAGGVRLLGPSSLGVAHPPSGLLLTANAAFAEPQLPAGPWFVASHSGSMIGALLSRGKALGVGFAGLVSVGGEIDLNLGEICEATLDDPGVGGYLLFLESLRHGAALRSFAQRAAQAGKPVLAYKLGRSAAAAEMAATHTGALAGEDDIADALLRGLGIARVGVLEALLEGPPLAARLPLGGGTARRVGVVTTTGGGAAMVVDQLGVRGIDVQPPSERLLHSLAAAGVRAAPGRVLDLTLAGTRPDVMRAALGGLRDSGEFDLVVAVVGSSARLYPELAVQPLVEAAQAAAGVPLAAMLVPDAPQALEALRAAGVPCFRTPESCADVVAALLRRETPSHAPVQPAGAGALVTLDEAQAYERIASLGVPCAPHVVRPLADAAPESLPFAYPVVAKLCSPDLPHKSDVGGVLLGIRDRAALDDALDQLRRNLADRAPHAKCDQVLLQAQARGVAEVLLGYRWDADAGPIVLLAAGGIWAEIAQDRSIRLAPVTLQTAREMVVEVRSLKAATGLRGQVAGDLEALAQAIVALSQLAVRPELGVVEAEVNPLLVLPQGEGVVAVDALVLARTAKP